MLRIENLHVHYGAAEALRGVDLEIPEGVTIALVGANGSGKTTLLRTLLGELAPLAGEVTRQIASRVLVQHNESVTSWH